MAEPLDRLEKRIREKVDEGLFASFEEAVTSIERWLDSLERQYIEEQMSNEDA